MYITKHTFLDKKVTNSERHLPVASLPSLLGESLIKFITSFVISTKLNVFYCTLNDTKSALGCIICIQILVPRSLLFKKSIRSLHKVWAVVLKVLIKPKKNVWYHFGMYWCLFQIRLIRCFIDYNSKIFMKFHSKYHSFLFEQLKQGFHLL